MNINALPRIRLAHLPTPVEELRRLSEYLGGPRILIKRDDQTGLATGGNKARKLEFLMADACEQGADTVVTAGAAQSNHCRQTAAAAARVGLACELVLGGECPAVVEGNLLLDHLLGARIHWAGGRRGECLEEVAERLHAEGKRPYVIPYGGSNAVGAAGYASAMLEVMSQAWSDEQPIDYIVTASSSGGTQAGLVVGSRATGYSGQIIGVRIDKHEEGTETYEQVLVRLSNELAAHLGMDAEFTADDFVLLAGYDAPGYGVVSAREREAIHLLAEQEGILLDPVYTGRAMGALIDLIRHGEFETDDTVLFWHTGGTPGLFAYARDLLSLPH